MHRLLLGGAFLWIGLCSTAVGNEVLRWNTVTLQMIRSDRMPPPKAPWALALVHLAIYDSINAITQTHEPYHVSYSANADTSAESAVASSAHTVLTELFPSQRQLLDQELAIRLSLIPDGPSQRRGIRLGRSVADAILELRKADFLSRLAQMPVPAAGVWVPTPPAFLPAMLPAWGATPPFVLETADQFSTTAPPKLKSEKYTRNYIEIQEIGSKDSETRTSDETVIALFWANGIGTATPGGIWNVFAQRILAKKPLSLPETARLFALLNLAIADTTISTWEEKYRFNFWRPVTAVREAGTDGNPNTEKDPAWEPLLTTPNFPDYPSGTSSFSSAAAEILTLYFGNISLTAVSENLGGVERKFRNFTDAAREAARSRVLGGVHFTFATKEGLRLGKRIAQYVWENALRPKQNGLVDHLRTRDRLFSDGMETILNSVPRP